MKRFLPIIGSIATFILCLTLIPTDLPVQDISKLEKAILWGVSIAPFILAIVIYIFLKSMVSEVPPKEKESKGSETVTPLK